MTANVLPNGLKLELEPSIGNHNEDFLAKWNDKLNKFSLTNNRHYRIFGKAITKTDAEIEDTNKELKGQNNQEQHNEVTATLNENQHTRKKQYKKNKDKKYYNLKYNIRNKPQRPQTNWSSDEDGNNNQYDQRNNQYQHSNNQNQQNNNFYKQSNNRNQQSNNQNHRNYASVTRRNISNTNLFSRPNSRRNSNSNLTHGTAQHTGRQHQSTNNENTTLRQRVQELEEQVKQHSTPNNTEHDNAGSLNHVQKKPEQRPKPSTKRTTICSNT